jgi:hypothetical protein
MDATPGTVPKTPPESDPRKKDQKMPASENSLSPEDFEDTSPKADGTVQTIDRETPGLIGN